MVCFLLKHLTYVTNTFGGLIFNARSKINTLALFFMNPHLFFLSVGAAAGYDTCQFNEALLSSKFVELNNMNTIP